MNKSTKVLIATVGTIAMFGVGTGPASASASGLTVTVPCGCQPVQDQPVGNAANTAAGDNPTGSVGNTSGAGQDQSGLIYPSAIVTFGG
jgi:hypothetical protein